MVPKLALMPHAIDAASASAWVSSSALRPSRCPSSWVATLCKSNLFASPAVVNGDCGLKNRSESTISPGSTMRSPNDERRVNDVVGVMARTPGGN